MTLNAKFVHSSLALRYLRAVAQQEHEVVLREFTIHDPVEVVVADLYELCPDVLGVSCYIWNIEEIMRILPVLRKVLPDTLIVLGGPEVSYDGEQRLRDCQAADVVVLGEGEETLRDLLRAHAAGQAYVDVPGLACRVNDGRTVTTRPRPKIPSLDAIASPYPRDRMHELRNRIVYFEASRGCPFHCQFCLSSIEDDVRYFSLVRVKTELRSLIDAGVRQIKFVDRTFNLRRDYAMELFAFLIAAPGGTTFHFEITGDILKPDVVAWLCENAPPGLFRFEIGVQSTNDATNSLVHRRQNFARLAATVEAIRDAGAITQHLDLIAGLPEEDYASFRKTFNDVFALRPEELQLGFLKLLRGTGLRLSAGTYGYVFMDSAPYELLYNNVLSYEDIIRLKRLEDVLEKYYNSGRFPHIVSYVCSELFPSAFEFFQALGDFWHDNGWSRIGHQPVDVALRLAAFLERSGVYDGVAAALLRADYLVREKLRPRTLWWRDETARAKDRAARGAELGVMRRIAPAHLGDVAHPDFRKRAILDRVPGAAAVRIVDGWKGDVRQEVDILYVFPTGAGHPAVYAGETALCGETPIGN